MPVMRELFGVACIRCAAAGHRCQAQVRTDEGALCLRCANDEPCIYITAAASVAAEPELDPFAIPDITRADRIALANMPRLASVYANAKLDPAVRAALATDRRLSAAQLAQKYHVSKATVHNLRAEHRRALHETRVVFELPKHAPEKNS
jgi:hypothetical protein